MAKLNFVKKARKDYPDHDIKKGDSYYWWQFMRGPKMFSKTRPRPSQLTRSEFTSELLSIQEEIEDFKLEDGKASDIESFIQDVCSRIEELKSNTEDKLSNMPQQLQDADTGQLLQERIDALDSWISELESIDCSFEDDLSPDSKKERIEEIINELQSTDPGL